MPPKTRDLVPADATDEMCAYEAERARRIASNRRRMAELGLATMASAAGLGAETRPGGGGGALPDGDARGRGTRVATLRIVREVDTDATVRVPRSSARGTERETRKRGR